MNKKGLFKSFLICTLAALSFTACGKKKNNTTTKDNTTTVAPEPDPEDVVAVNSYYSKVNAGILALEAGTVNEKLDYVSFVSGEANGFPVVLQPVIENNQITKIRYSVFLGINDGGVYYIKTIELSNNGVMLPFDLDYSDIDEGNEQIFVKKNDGKLNIYNRGMNILIDYKGNVTSNELINASGKQFVGNTEIEKVGEKYIIYSDEMNMRINCNPKDLSVEMIAYNPYFKDYVSVAKYKVNLNESNPTARIIANSTAYVSEGLSFNRGKEIDGGFVKTKLNSNGDVIECEAAMTMRSDKTNPTYLKYDDNNRLISFTFYDYDYEKEHREYQYTYDDKGRVSSFSSGYIDNDEFYPTRKDEYTYNEFGYRTEILTTNYSYDDSNKIEYTDIQKDINEYDNNNNLVKITHSYKDEEEFKVSQINTYTYNGIQLTKEETSHPDYPINNSYTLYEYDDKGRKIKENEYKYYDNSGTLTEYLSWNRTKDYSKDEDLFSYIDKSERYFINEGVHTKSEEMIESYKWLDADYKYIKSSEFISNDLIGSTTSYEKYIYTYSESKQLTNVHFEGKDDDEDTPTITDYVYTYDTTSSKINYSVETTSIGSTKSSKITTTYDETGKIKEIENTNPTTDAKISKTVYKYDASGNLTRMENYKYYDNEGIKNYLIAAAQIFDATNPLVPVGMEQYSYSTDGVLQTKVVIDFYNIIKNTVKSQITYVYSNNIVTIKDEQYHYDNKNNTLEKTVNTVFDTTGKIMQTEDITIYYDDATSTTKEISHKEINSAGDTYTGTRTTYKADGTTDKEYIWNDTTKSWDEKPLSA